MDLNQKQKEVIIDLLILAKHTDKRIALEESAYIEKFSDIVNWESGISISSHINEATAKVNHLKAADISEFVSDIAGILETDAAKQYARTGVCQLLASDGVTTDVESELLKIIDAVF
jgi:hypothetical protein